MNDRKSIDWLYKQLPDLQSKGIVDGATAKRIQEFYGPASKPPAYSWAFVIAGVLGAILIGGGIILIFAYNWDQLSKFWRTILSLAPLVIAQLIYGFAFYKKSKRTAWVEGSSGFLMMMLAASIALISQTYHIEGSLEGFLFVWMILSIPLMYLMNASLPAFIYLIGICSWAVQADGSHAVFYWGLLLAAAPHMIYNFRAPSQIRANLLAWTLVITLTISWFAVIEAQLSIYLLLGTAFMLSAMYLSGDRWFSDARNLLSKPFQVFATTGIFIFCMILGYEWPTESVDLGEWLNGDRYTHWAGKVNFLVWWILVSVWAFLSLRYFQNNKTLPWFVSLFPILVLVGMGISTSSSSVIPIVLANLYLLVSGIYYIRRGINEHDMVFVNVGMLFVTVLIIARFFDTDWSFVIKGVAFVVLGICFLGVNVVLSRKLKAEKMLE